MELDMFGYTIVQNDACSNARVYRDGRLVLYLSTNGPLDEQGLFDILAAVSERDGGAL